MLHCKESRGDGDRRAAHQVLKQQPQPCLMKLLNGLECVVKQDTRLRRTTSLMINCKGHNLLADQLISLFF